MHAIQFYGQHARSGSSCLFDGCSARVQAFARKKTQLPKNVTCCQNQKTTTTPTPTPKIAAAAAVPAIMSDPDAASAKVIQALVSDVSGKRRTRGGTKRPVKLIGGLPLSCGLVDQVQPSASFVNGGLFSFGLCTVFCCLPPPPPTPQ